LARYEATDDRLINSLVGEGTHFRGDLELSGLLRIDGDYSGSIHATGKVIIGNGGRADCNIEAGVAVIGGILRGDIFCTNKIIILASAIVIGNLHAPRIVAEEGTMIHGRLVITGVEEFERRWKSIRGTDTAVRQGAFRPVETSGLGGDDDPFAAVDYNNGERVTSAGDFDPETHE